MYLLAATVMIHENFLAGHIAAFPSEVLTACVQS